VLWFGLALGAALAQSGQFAIVKGRAAHVPPSVMIVWSQLVGALGWAAWLAIAGGPFLPAWAEGPWIALAMALALTMNYLLARGSARGDIGIVGPVLALSPVFTVVPDLVLTGALPRGLGWVGLALSVVGTMSLSGKTSLRALGQLFRRPDALDALGAAVSLGVLAAVDRRNGLAMGVATYLFASHSMGAVVAAGIAAARAPRALARTFVTHDLVAALAYGLTGAVGTAMQIVAVTLAPASYVNAIRRTSAIFSVLLGHALFHEPALGARLGGALLASVGAALLLLG